MTPEEVERWLRGPADGNVSFPPDQREILAQILRLVASIDRRLLAAPPFFGTDNPEDLRP